MSIHHTHHHGRYSVAKPWHTKTSSLAGMAKAVEMVIPEWLPRALAEHHELTNEEIKRLQHPENDRGKR